MPWLFIDGSATNEYRKNGQKPPLLSPILPQEVYRKEEDEVACYVAIGQNGSFCFSYALLFPQQ